MTVTHRSTTPHYPIAFGRERYHAHAANLMVVVFDFNDGPGVQPDPPHSHPHEQITYVAAGRVMFFIGENQYELSEGDLITVPPDAPHSIQLLTPTARLVDSFSPVREDMLAADKGQK